MLVDNTAFRIKVGIAAASAFMAVVTVALPDWIEQVFALEPDGSDGSVEWLLVAVFTVVALVAGALARVELRRSQIG